MKDFLIHAFIIIVVVSLSLGLFSGMLDSSRECPRPFTKRYQYLIPSSMISCPAARWIQELEVYKD